MLTSLNIENYRGFEKYQLSDLARVNLLVGLNNCGKTSILEAVHFIASRGDPSVLAVTAWQRGEIIVARVDLDVTNYPARRPGPDRSPDMSHFFFRHEFAPGSFFQFSSDDGFGDVGNGFDCLRVEVTDRSSVELSELVGSSELVERSRAGLELSIYKSKHIYESKQLPGEVQRFPVSEDGALLEDRLSQYRPYPSAFDSDSRVVQFISSDSLEARVMSELWDYVVTEGCEEQAIRAMQILEPDLQSIHFLSGERGFGVAGKSGILVGFKGQKRRIPLGSHGEGMRRLLALSLALIRTQGGVLLVDEIDTGLHYSVMDEMWRLVIGAAKLFDVQVFATTHSLDCLRGLSQLVADDPAHGTEVSVQKIDRSLNEAIAFDANNIQIAVEQEIEVR